LCRNILRLTAECRMALFDCPWLNLDNRNQNAILNERQVENKRIMPEAAAFRGDRT